MSAGELERVEVMGRVANEELKLTDAAAMLQLSYRQVKCLWRRYRQKGSKGLQHGNAGRPSNRGKPAKFRGRGLGLIKRKYSGSEDDPMSTPRLHASLTHTRVAMRATLGHVFL